MDDLLSENESEPELLDFPLLKRSRLNSSQLMTFLDSPSAKNTPQGSKSTCTTPRGPQKTPASQKAQKTTRGKKVDDVI